MAENKFVVKTVFHDENGDTLLREDYRETREKAQELKDLADFGYAGLFGKGPPQQQSSAAQTRVAGLLFTVFGQEVHLKSCV